LTTMQAADNSIITTGQPLLDGLLVKLL